MSDSTERAVEAGLPVRAIRLSVIAGAPEHSRVFKGDHVRVGSAEGNDLVVAHPTVSRFHLSLTRDAQHVRVSDLGSTNGTRVGPVLLRDASATLTESTVLSLGDVKLKLEDADVVIQPLHDLDSLGGLRGSSAQMRRLMADVRQLSQSEVPVLIIGESGTGKELIARAIHDLSDRNEGPFVIVDCAAIPPSVFAAELFGYERGAFTGADRRRAGALERAHGGTVFFDELGELPPTLQASLLGALERRKFQRVGGEQEVPFDVRIVSATNRELRKDVNSGAFRLDLFYRLAVVLLEVPPLRKRPEDVPLLVRHFGEESGASSSELEGLFSPEFLQQLQSYEWPGNVRELRNLVAAALAMGRTPDLATVSAVTPAASDDVIGAVLHMSYRDARAALLDQFEHRFLKNLLDKTSGNVRAAAREGKINRSYLIELLKRHGLG